MIDHRRIEREQPAPVPVVIESVLHRSARLRRSTTTIRDQRRTRRAFEVAYTGLSFVQSGSLDVQLPARTDWTATGSRPAHGERRITRTFQPVTTASRSWSPIATVAGARARRAGVQIDVAAAVLAHLVVHSGGPARDRGHCGVRLPPACFRTRATRDVAAGASPGS